VPVQDALGEFAATGAGAVVGNREALAEQVPDAADSDLAGGQVAVHASLGAQAADLVLMVFPLFQIICCFLSIALD
jgi:hypothetical protein